MKKPAAKKRASAKRSPVAKTKRRAKPAARRTKRAAAPKRKATRARAAKPSAARKRVAKPSPRGRAPAPAAPNLERTLARERSTRRRLERLLVEAVREIGQIRHFEARARALEEELRRRDEELATFRRAAGIVHPQNELPFSTP